MAKPQQVISFDFETLDQATRWMRRRSTRKLRRNHGAKNGTATAESCAITADRSVFRHYVDAAGGSGARRRCALTTSTSRCNLRISGCGCVAWILRSRLDQDFYGELNFAAEGGEQLLRHRQLGISGRRTSTTNQTEDASSFTADESEYNDINTTANCLPIHDISRSLAYITQKKSMLYSLAAIQRNGS